MVRSAHGSLSLEEFLSLPVSDGSYELVNGEVIPKVSPKRFHAGVQKALLKLLDDWAEGKGHFFPEWAVVLERNGEPWVPVPDLTYVSFDRLAADWLDDEPCPVPPDLAIEIFSPTQSFGVMLTKAEDYLEAGVSRVWIVDPQAQTITVFSSGAFPITYQRGDVLQDQLFSSLAVKVDEIFLGAGL